MLTKKSCRVTTLLVAWPTSVCTVTPRAVSRHSLALLGRVNFTVALPLASVMMAGSH